MHRGASRAATVLLSCSILSLAGAHAVAADDYWKSGFAAGFNGPVLSMVEYDGDLVVGGDFSAVGAVSAGNIARWNGTSWQSMGGGTDGPVHGLHVHMGDLVVGGYFSEAGPFDAHKVARWNGSSWSTYGDGFNATVYDFATYNGLVAAGDFSLSATDSVSRIADWSGSNWTPLGSGLNNIVIALERMDATLYAGGYFSLAGTDPISRVAAWDGSSWSALGDGLQGGYLNLPFAYDLAVFDGDLIAAGRFDTAGNTAAANIARWDGFDWHALGAGIGGLGVPAPTVYALALYHGELIAAGDFTEAGGAAANNIARWNGTAWTPLAAGLNDDGYAITEYEGSLFSGGIFTSAGIFQSQHIGEWEEPPPVTFSGRIPDGGELPGEPFRVFGTVLPTFYGFSWSASCSAFDTDYALYEGDLGDFTSHVPLTCSTSGATSATFSLFPDSKYYLVVPRTDDHEGSYGKDADGERRPSSAACATQEIGVCE